MELGWLIERPGHKYLGVDDTLSLGSYLMLTWTDHDKAIRFARKIDAERAAKVLTNMNEIKIVEHAWID